MLDPFRDRLMNLLEAVSAVGPAGHVARGVDQGAHGRQ